VTGAEAIKALPATVRFGPFTFQIKVRSNHAAHAESEWGRCSPIEHIIYMQEDFPTSVKAADTFLHECLHAIFWTYGVRDDDKEERTVSTAATGLVALHLDNPWLAGWISAALA
jgi:hypothetical protein